MSHWIKHNKINDIEISIISECRLLDIITFYIFAVLPIPNMEAVEQPRPRASRELAECGAICSSHKDCVSHCNYCYPGTAGSTMGRCTMYFSSVMNLKRNIGQNWRVHVNLKTRPILYNLLYQIRQNAWNLHWLHEVCIVFCSENKYWMGISICY